MSHRYRASARAAGSHRHRAWARRWEPRILSLGSSAEVPRSTEPGLGAGSHRYWRGARRWEPRVPSLGSIAGEAMGTRAWARLGSQRAPSLGSALRRPQVLSWGSSAGEPWYEPGLQRWGATGAEALEP